MYSFLKAFIVLMKRTSVSHECIDEFFSAKHDCATSSFPQSMIARPVLNLLKSRDTISFLFGIHECFFECIKTANV